MTTTTQPASHDFAHIHSRLMLTGTVMTKTGLRIGSGTGESLTGADISVVKDALGRPYIPGSSLKGILRSIIEQLVRTIDGTVGPGQGACNPLVDDQRCISSDVMKTLRNAYKQHPKLLAAEVLTRSCRVCRVFGSPWLAAKVLIKDLSLTGDWVERYDLRNGVGIDRDSGTAATGFLYSYETVPAGVSFGLTVVVENADLAEQGLVLWGLREFESERAQLGGARSRGLGWVKLDGLTAGYVDGSDRQALLNYLSSGQAAVLQSSDLDERLRALGQQLSQSDGR